MGCSGSELRAATSGPLHPCWWSFCLPGVFGILWMVPEGRVGARGIEDASYSGWGSAVAAQVVLAPPGLDRSTGTAGFLVSPGGALSPWASGEKGR